MKRLFSLACAIAVIASIASIFVGTLSGSSTARNQRGIGSCGIVKEATGVSPAEEVDAVAGTSTVENFDQSCLDVPPVEVPPMRGMMLN